MMAQDILQAVLQEAQKHDGKRVKTICIRVGAEHSEESESIQFCLETLIKGTAAEGAQIDVEPVDEDARHHDPVEVMLQIN